MIYKEGLAKFLEPTKRVVADGGYRGSASELVKCPGVVEVDPDNVEMQQKVRSRQEMVNGLFKKLGNIVHPILPPAA
jgi:hypothetical protein